MSSLMLAASRQRLLLPCTTSLISRLAKSSNQIECFSTKPLSGSEYIAAKKASKNKRRELYAAHEAREQRLKTRRDGKPKNEKKKEFLNWFIKYKVNDEYMERKARQAGLDWKIHVAVALERPNRVVPDMEDWQEEWENLNAYLSIHQRKDYHSNILNFDPDDPETPAPTTQEEMLALLPEEYVPAPRETEADATGDVRTTDRKLKTSIFLAVKENNLWQLPTVPLNPDETLLQAARRAIPEKVGKDVEFWCPSNCPCGVEMTPFPEEERKDGFYGIKTFVMKVEYDEGPVSQEDMTVEDFAWLDRGELAERVKEERGETASNFYRYLL